MKATELGVNGSIGHGLLIDLLLWTVAVVAVLVVNASQSRSAQERRRMQRLLVLVALLALGVVLARDL